MWLIGKHAVGSGGAETLENEDNGTFPGLIPLVQEYLRNIDIDTDTMCTLSRYFKVTWLMINVKKYINSINCSIVSNNYKVSCQF